MFKTPPSAKFRTFELGNLDLFRISDFGFRILGAFVCLPAFAQSLQAQPRPYIGFVYPAGGQKGTTFQIRLGGQGLNEVNAVVVSR